MDPDGNLYVETADAPFDANNTPGADYGDSILKLTASAVLSDYFEPLEQEYLFVEDLDLGSTGPLVIDNNRPDAAVPHLLIGSGKVADVYVMNRDNMGGFCSTCQSSNSNIVQDVARPPDFGGCIPVVGHTSNCRYGSPAYFNAGGPSSTADGFVYYPTNGAGLLSYPISNGVLATTPLRGAKILSAPGAPSVSSNGTSSGIVWVINRSSENSKTGANTGTLYAYDAVTLAQLYTSDQAAEGREPAPCRQSL